MRNCRNILASFLTVLLVVLVAGCGKETVNVPDTAPFVISTVPAQSAGGVGLNPTISATFNKAMAASSVTTAGTFTVTGAAGAIAGAVTLAGNTATFTPTAPLAAQDATYTATITIAAKDLAGTAMLAPYVWTFETIEVPSVVSTSPAAGATNVAVNQTVSAAFLQDIDSPNASLNCATLTATTFTLTSPAGPVTGAVTCAGAIATFTPALPLAPNTTYTATLTTGAQNLAGSGLAAAFIWTFSTEVAPSITATVPASGATGVLLNQAISATFSAPMNCATLYSPARTFTLTGPAAAVIPGIVSCTASGATFTPAALLTPNTLYTATITSGAKDPTGQSLAGGVVPNPWSFRTAPAIISPTVVSTVPAPDATAVPINQAIAATFSEAMDPATITNTSFTVTGPGGVSVGGVVKYLVTGSIATFTPVVDLAPLTTYVATITTGASDLATPPEGLAANYTWSFTTGLAPDTTAPTVVATIPTSAATGIPINQAVNVTFSKAMDPATVNDTTFTLTGPGGAAVTGLIVPAAGGLAATFTPAVALAPNTAYTALITAGAKDLAGNALIAGPAPNPWSFTTAQATTTTGPTVTLTSPVNAAGNVPVNAAVSATFSKAMDPLTIPGSFTLAGPGGALILGTVGYDPLTFIATFTPTNPLASGTTYIATVTTGATDLAANPLAPGVVPNPWSFTTGIVVVPPAVPLGTAAGFGGIGGGAGMTNQGTSTYIGGNIGTTGVSTVITGFHDRGPGCTYTESPLNIGFVNGSVYTAPPPPTVGCPTEGTSGTPTSTFEIATQASADALTAYNDMVAFPNGLDVSTCPGCGGGGAGELGNRTLAPGIYKSAPGSYGITLGDLTLDAQGDPNAFWVFQMATTLTVGNTTVAPLAPHSVILINGAQAKNVFWQVGARAHVNEIVGGGTMVGTIIAGAGVTVSTAGVANITTITGRVLSLGPSVTLVNTVINVPAP